MKNLSMYWTVESLGVAESAVSPLGYIWFSLICFLIQIYSYISNLRIIRYFDSIIDDKSKETYFIICSIIVSITIVASSISTVLNFIEISSKQNI